MNAYRVISNLKERGFEYLGRCKGKSGYCHLVFSKRGSGDHGEQQSRAFYGIRMVDPEPDWVVYIFSVTRTAFRSEAVLNLIGDIEHLLLQAGLNRFKFFLNEDDTPGRVVETQLNSKSPKEDFIMQETDELHKEVRRVRYEVLHVLWQNRYQGIKRTEKQSIEDSACTTSVVLDSVLNSLERRNLTKGAFGSSGIKITDLGEAEFEKLRKEIERIPQPRTETIAVGGTHMDYDIFISHASEDKEPFVDSLAITLKEKGLKVWYDAFTLKLGDSLRASIDHGLASSRYGLVVLSHHFFQKEWTQRELNGLFAQMDGTDRRILPIWYGLTVDQVKHYSPMMADIVAVKSSEGVEKVTNKIVEICIP